MSNTDTFVPVVSKAAVWVGRAKRFRDATVQISGSTLQVLVMRNSRVAAEWEIAETVKAGQAWDVREGNALTRVVAQAGCGCGGMAPYAPDPGYSGNL